MATWQVRFLQNPWNDDSVRDGNNPFVIYRVAQNGDLFALAFTGNGLVERLWTPGQVAPVHYPKRALGNWRAVVPPPQYDLTTDLDPGT